MDFHSASACFYNHVHSIGVHFDNFIHALQQQHNAAAHGDSTAGDAGTGATRSNRHKIFVSQLHDGSNLFCATWQYNYLGQMMVVRIRLFVGLIALQSFGVVLHEFGAHNSAQLC